MRVLPASERRQQNLHPSGVGTYTPGIRRLETLVEQNLRDHDQWFRSASLPGLQHDYSLLTHAVQVMRVVERMAERRGRRAEDIFLAKVSGLFHDAGKLVPCYSLYRANREFTAEERTMMFGHAAASGDFVLWCMSQVRAPDRAFLTEVYLIVRDHHTPWNIGDARLREIAFDLMLADMFVARMENRHRPGLSQFESLEKVRAISEELVKKRPAHAREIESGISILNLLYGIDPSITIEGR